MGRAAGFDSLVQVATGIAAVEGSEEKPGALPAQALDHGTGYLLAAGVLRAVTEGLDEGGTRFVRPALARTAAWLTAGDAAGRGGATAEASRSGTTAAAASGSAEGSSEARTLIPALPRPRTAIRRPGSRRRTVPWDGCGTPCRRCPSRAGRATGRGLPGPGVRIRLAGSESEGGRARMDGRNVVCVSGIPFRQLFARTCPDLDDW